MRRRRRRSKRTLTCRRPEAAIAGGLGCGLCPGEGVEVSEGVTRETWRSSTFVHVRGAGVRALRSPRGVHRTGAL